MSFGNGSGFIEWSQEGCHGCRLQYQTGGGTGCHAGHQTRTRSGARSRAYATPPDKTVSAAPRVLQPNISAANYQQMDSERISKEVIIDKGAGEIVFVSVDKKSNQVIDQYPEESRLRSRAYLRAMDTLKQDAKLLDRRMETDRSV
jgi:uncharacterized FlaG/YvyC family protein